MIEHIFDKMLRVPSVTTLVNQRIALTQLPQNTTYPAIVYELVSGNPKPHLNYQREPFAECRFQVNPLAKTIAVVKSIHAAVRGELDFRHAVTVDGVRIVSIRLDGFGPVDRDDEVGIWTQPADYVVQFFEA